MLCKASNLEARRSRLIWNSCSFDSHALKSAYDFVHSHIPTWFSQLKIDLLEVVTECLDLIIRQNFK
jgi:hypothetical protein